MVTKNAVMGKKVTKQTISKPSNTVLRKVDKPRTAMTMLKKEYSNLANAKDKARKKDLDGVKFADLEAVGYDNKMRKNLKKQAQVQKVIDSRTKANNKDLSKSLGSVASNKGMKKSDVKGTVKLAEKTLSDAKQRLRTHDASMGGTKQQHDALKKQVKTAERNLKSLNNTASRRK